MGRKGERREAEPVATGCLDNKANGIGRSKSVRCAACLLLAALLGGCVDPLQERAPSESAPKEITVEAGAPRADFIADRQIEAVLHYLSADGTQLRAQVATVTVRGGESEAEAVLRVLIGDAPPQGLRAPVPGGALHNAAHPVVVAGDVATVMLSPAARMLTAKELFAARMAITNTLTELSYISYVNVLVEGMEEGVALGGNIPCGALTRQSAGDVDAAWRQLESQQEDIGQQGFSKLVTVYVPAPGGQFIIPQVRNITFADAQPATLIHGVLWELSKGAIGLANTPALPDLTRYLLREPEVLAQANSAVRVIRLNFYQELDEALAQCGVSKGMLCALLTQSISTFLPNVRGVQLHIGVDTLTELGAADALDGRPISADIDMWSPDKFWNAVGAFCPIALPNQSGTRLVRVERPVRAVERWQPRTLLKQMLSGPQPADARQDLAAAMPQGVTGEDFLAISLQDGMALVNLSSRFAEACKGLSEQEERNAVYAVVNMLTEFSQVRRVAFFVEGEQVRSLAGGLELRGTFMRNPGLFE